MKDKITAVEIGQRCRKFRQVLGLSQQALADMIGTTPQNISKYEKEGIYNIDIIQELSIALEQDLLKDEAEQEGNIGEVGAEILFILLEERGCIDYASLLKHDKLFGLPEERVIRELFRLQQIGLLIREKYVDRKKDEYDKVFITAKGIISYKHKNIDAYTKAVGDFEYVISYEVRCEGYSSIQDHIDHIEVGELLEKLDFVSGFRANLIYYIIQQKEIDFGHLNIIEYADRISGVGIYHDIIHSLITKTSRKTADFLVSKYKAVRDGELFINHSYDQIAADIIGDDIVLEDFLLYLSMTMSANFDIRENLKSLRNKLFLQYPNCKENIELHNYLEEIENQYECMDDAKCYYSDFLDRKGCSYSQIFDIENLFTKEEIIEFIDENVLPAKSEDEKALEKLIREILIKYPELMDYFRFPTVWEENGVADYIREKYYMEGVEALEPKGKEIVNPKKPEFDVIFREFDDEMDISHKQVVDKASGAIIYDADEYSDPDFVNARTKIEKIKALSLAASRCPQYQLRFSDETLGFDITDVIPLDELEKFRVDNKAIEDED